MFAKSIHTNIATAIAGLAGLLAISVNALAATSTAQAARSAPAAAQPHAVPSALRPVGPPAGRPSSVPPMPQITPPAPRQTTATPNGTIIVPVDRGPRGGVDLMLTPGVNRSHTGPTIDSMGMQFNRGSTGGGVTVGTDGSATAHGTYRGVTPSVTVGPGQPPSYGVTIEKTFK